MHADSMRCLALNPDRISSSTFGSLKASDAVLLAPMIPAVAHRSPTMPSRKAAMS